MVPQRTFRILIVEDHPIVRQGYSHLIGSQADFEICGFAATAEEALAQAITTKPHLAIVDITLEEGHGIALIRELLARQSHLKILVVSAHDERMFAERALEAGAFGYLGKGEATEHLLQGIRTVLAGEVFLSEQMSQRLLKHRIGTGRSQPARAVLLDRLTDRELEVFQFIGQGRTTRQIANQLNLSPKTIERYRENIKRKLGLANATELLQRATSWVLNDR